MYINCGTKVCPPVVHPTKCCVINKCYNYVVPEIHPSHTTTVNHINYNHVHSFPHTESCATEVTNTESIAPPGMGYGMPLRPGFGQDQEWGRWVQWEDRCFLIDKMEQG